MIYTKSNIVTNQWLVNRKESIRVANEAFKAKARNVAKTSALYGSMIVFICTALGLGVAVGTLKIQDFFRNNEVAFALPVEMKVWTNPVVSVRPLEAPTVAVLDTLRIKVIANAKDKTLAQKIYDTFTAKGLDGQKAVAVSMAESGMNCEATGANTNGTSDLSAMQVNTVHLDRYKLAELASCERNIEIAAELVAEQGWGIFSTVNNGRYLQYMDIGLSYAGE